MSSALESSYVGMLEWMMTSRSCNLVDHEVGYAYNNDEC